MKPTKSLTHKLISGLLFSSTLPVFIMGVATIFIIHSISLNEVRQKILNNLHVVESVYKNAQDKLKYVVRDQNRRIFTLLELGQPELLRATVAKNISQDNLDFFIITDNQGKVLISLYPEVEGKSLGYDLAVQRAEVGDITVSTEILNEDALASLGLTKKAAIPGLNKTEGLVIKAVLPIINREESIIGTMVAGYLLNNDSAIISDIKKATGLNSSILLDNLRIASNVPAKTGELAIGTRLNLHELGHIKKEGLTHIGDIEIMGKSYLSGYVPIRNYNEDIVGSVGIAIPKAVVFVLRNKVVMIFAIAVFFSAFLAFMYGFLRARVIVNAIEKLRKGTEAVSKGDFQYEIRIDTHDEIGDLAKFFNKMTAQLRIYKEELSQYSRGLEEKVREKTHELDAANKQLIEYAKMAAMGKMATAISHELRNVFAGIQTVTYYLKAKAAKDFPKLADSIRDIEEDVSYASSILDNILKFSRPKKLAVTDADINLIADSALSSINLQETFKNNKIELTKSLDPGIPRIKADSIQLKEVILNLIINAIQAMPSGGKLGIITKKQEKSITLEVSDTGAGISQESLAHLFTPFYTTKSKGLGLGLCISREIVEEHKGKMEVRTELGKGTTFMVVLPLALYEKTV